MILFVAFFDKGCVFLFKKFFFLLLILNRRYLLHTCNYNLRIYNMHSVLLSITGELPGCRGDSDVCLCWDTRKITQHSRYARVCSGETTPELHVWGRESEWATGCFLSTSSAATLHLHIRLTRLSCASTILSGCCRVKSSRDMLAALQTRLLHPGHVHGHHPVSRLSLFGIHSARRRRRKLREP